MFSESVKEVLRATGGLLLTGMCVFVCVAAVAFVIGSFWHRKDLTPYEWSQQKIGIVTALVLLVLFAIGAYRLGADCARRLGLTINWGGVECLTSGILGITA